MVAVGSKSIPEKQSISLNLSKETEDNQILNYLVKFSLPKALTMSLFQRIRVSLTMIRLILKTPSI